MRLLQEIVHAAHCVGNHCSHALRILLIQRYFCVLQCFLDSSEDEMGHAISPVYQLALDVIIHHKITDLASYRNWQIRDRMAWNRLDTGDSSACRVPECLLSNTVCRYYA